MVLVNYHSIRANSVKEMIFLRFYVLFALALSKCSAAPAGTDTDSLLEMIKTLQIRVKELERTDAMLVNEVDVLKRSDVQITEKVDLVVGAWQDGKQITADSLFLATISAFSVPVSPGEPIVWDSAPINPGGHFNTILGMYTAPVTGYYQFSVSKHGSDNRGSFFVLVDEVKYAFYEEYDPDDSTQSGSATINIQLTAGQVVRMENDVSTVLYGTHSTGFIYSWFTGHLLYAL